ncbi:MAG TPA: IspD/TarI family cytidylyltransferase, partial [Methylovirgula sp.]
MTEPRESAILVVAAGRGSRAGPGIPKQYREIAGYPLLTHTLAALLKSAPSAKLITVVHPDDADFYAGAVAHFSSQDLARLYAPTPGGETRQDSVRLGLEALTRAPSPPDIVLIHDGARPFASPTLIARATQAALKHGAAVPGLALVDTVKEVDHAGRVVATPQRTSLRTVQTPQAFRF